MFENAWREFEVFAIVPLHVRSSQLTNLHCVRTHWHSYRQLESECPIYFMTLSALAPLIVGCSLV